MSWLQPFYGGTIAGQRLAAFLNRLLILVELALVFWHILAMTESGSFQYSFFFWLAYFFLVVLASKIVSSVFRFLCRLFLAIKYGATDPGTVMALGQNRDRIKAQRKAEFRNTERNKSGSGKEDASASSDSDPYNIEKNREIFRKL